MQILKGHCADKPVRSLAFSPDGTQLASSARGDKTFLWDLATGKHQVIDNWESCAVAFAPDGNAIATGRDTGLCVWGRDTDERRSLAFPRPGTRGMQVAYSPDGLLLAAASAEVRLWHAGTLEPILLGPSGLRATSCLAFAPDGCTLATGHARGPAILTEVGWEVDLWDLTAFTPRATLRGPRVSTDALAFSPDGRWLAAAAGATLWVWEVDSGAVVLTHQVNAMANHAVAFSPDGAVLAAARGDATVRLWQTQGWREAACYDWRIGPMYSLCFAPDGMRAAGGSGMGKIVVWDIDL